MNTKDSTTKFCFTQAYRLARLSAKQSGGAGSVDARMVRYYIQSNVLYIAALSALASRHSHAAALMARPVTSVDQSRWLIDYRCREYTRTSGRMPG